MESQNLQHWTRIGTMNRERGALLRPDVETATRGAMLRAPTDRFMESSVFLSDLLTAHEPEFRKPLEINKTIFRFMGRA